MGFVFKSAIGLGCVYFAMFGQALRSADIAPTAKLCASAAKAGLMGDAAERAQWAAAGCAVALSSETRRLAKPSGPPPLRDSEVAQRQPQVASKAGAGTLSSADLHDPWFGPGRIQRKSERRG